MKRTYEKTFAENFPRSGGGYHMKKIIVVDYDQTFHPYIRILMERLGYIVMPAKKGIDVLKFVQFEQPDAIILDMEENIKDGMIILSQIKINGKTSFIPLIIVHANLTSEIIENCKKLGCAGYLTKPIRIEELYNMLVNLFSSRTTRRKHVRVLVNKKVQVIHRGKEYTLYTANFSEGGMYIRKTNPFPIGSSLEITIPLKNEDPITIKGVVVHVKGLLDDGDVLNSITGMGVQFKEITDKQIMTLKRYKEQVFAEDIFRGTFLKYS